LQWTLDKAPMYFTLTRVSTFARDNGEWKSRNNSGRFRT